MAIGFLPSGELLQNIKGFILDFSTSLQKKHNKEINMLRKCQILILCIYCKFYSLSYIYNCVQVSILKNFHEFRTKWLNGCVLTEIHNTFRLKIFQLFYCSTYDLRGFNPDLSAGEQWCVCYKSYQITDYNHETTEKHPTIDQNRCLPNPTNSDKGFFPGTP